MPSNDLHVLAAAKQLVILSSFTTCHRTFFTHFESTFIMSSASRPRRANANLHPAKIILSQKQVRRSPAEVARERADIEAQREALLRRREEDTKRLAELDLQLKQQEAEAERDALTASLNELNATLASV